jgi:CSLREA domain-containing protein
MRSRGCIFGVVAVTGALALCAPTAALGTVINVTTTADTLGGGRCSLRAAISAANTDSAVAGCPAGSGTDTVLVPAGRYVLALAGADEDANATGDLDISSDVVISGAGAASTTVDANGIDRVFDIHANSTATIEGVTITGGRAPDGADGANAAAAGSGADSVGGDAAPQASGGGGVYNQGTLTLRDDVVSANIAGTGGNGGAGGPGGAGVRPECGDGGTGGSSIGGHGGLGGVGGGVFSIGTLAIVASQILDNRAGDGGRGGDSGAGGAGGLAGGLGTRGGAGGASAGGSGGGGGPGGGVEALGGTLTLTDCVISANRTGAGGDAGAAGTAGAGAAESGTVHGGVGGASGFSSLFAGAGPGGEGGGVDAEVPTKVTGCTISANATANGGSGESGGRAGDGGSVSGTGSSGDGGSAYGGYGSQGGDGAGVAFNADMATLTLKSSTLSSNTTGDGGEGGAGGAGGSGGSGASTGVSGGSQAGSGGDGGFGSGLWVYGGLGGSGTATVSASTVTANAAGSGGGGGDGGAGPATSEGGGGGTAGEAAIVTDVDTSAVTLSHMTVSANAVGSPAEGGGAGTGTVATAGAGGGAAMAGGIWDFGIGTHAALAASIVSGNAVAECAGTVTNAGFDVSFPDASCPGINTDPRLGALADNGGPTQTRALLAGSAALGAIPAGDALCAGADQRGVAIAPAAACDIGAYEAVAPTVMTGVANGLAPIAATVTATVAANGPSASVHFEYGTTVAYGSATPQQTLGAGVSPQAVTAALSGLLPGATYHYRVVASNPDGTSIGTDRTFTTPINPPGSTPAPPPANPSGPTSANPSGVPAAFRGLTLIRQSVRLTRTGAAPIKVFCPAATHGTCAGKLKLTTKVKTKASNGKHKTITVTLGTVNFTVAAGKHKTLDVRLSKRARAHVKRARKLSSTATATAGDDLKRSKTTSATITIRPSRRQRQQSAHGRSDAHVL